MKHVLAAELRLDGNRVSARSDTPGSNAGLRLEGLHPDVRDGLDGHTRDVNPGRVFLRRSLDVTVDGDALELGDVVEVDGFAKKSQDITATGSAQLPVLVIGRAVVPLTQTGRFWRRLEAWRCMYIAEGEDVRGDGGLEGLLDSGQGERARNEETGGGIRGRRRSVRVKRTTIIFRRAELVTGGRGLEIRANVTGRDSRVC